MPAWLFALSVVLLFWVVTQSLTPDAADVPASPVCRQDLGAISCKGAR